jgi:hypothetical protein
MSKRWRRAFFRVNDRRRLVDQMSQWDWLKIGPDREEDARVPARLATLLVDTVTEESETQHEEVPIVPLVVRDIAKSHITREQLRDATREICARGDAAARAKCATHDIGHFKHLVRFDAATNVVSGNKWTIAGTWTFLTSRRP